MLRTLIRLAAVALLFASGAAAAEESSLNREGFWTVGRGDAGSTYCMASLSTRSGETFLLRAVAGQVNFAVGGRRPLRGRKAEISTEAYAFTFEPSFSKGGILISEEPMGERALAALRLAHGLIVTLDGRKVFNANVEGTGLEGALDAVIACSNGKSGWWGSGVAEPPEADIAGALNAEGFWYVRANLEEESCTAYAKVKDGTAFVLVAVEGGISFSVHTDKTLRQGRKGVLETEAYTFHFEPSYDDNDLYLDGALSGQALAAIRLARALRISVEAAPLPIWRSKALAWMACSTPSRTARRARTAGGARAFGLGRATRLVGPICRPAPVAPVSSFRRTGWR